MILILLQLNFNLFGQNIPRIIEAGDSVKVFSDSTLWVDYVDTEINQRYQITQLRARLDSVAVGLISMRELKNNLREYQDSITLHYESSNEQYEALLDSILLIGNESADLYANSTRDNLALIEKNTKLKKQGVILGGVAILELLIILIIIK